MRRTHQLEHLNKVMRKPLNEEQVKEFLKELSKLTRRYKIKIGGCGCCGSPHLTQFDKTDGRYEVAASQFDMLHWKKSESDT